MNCLVFPEFIPKSESTKDMSNLVDAIKNSNAYAKESLDTKCVFVRGSSVSSFESTIIPAHSNSDVDIVVVSPRRNRYVNQYRETLYSGHSSIEMPIDVTNLNQDDLEKEVSGRGSNGVSSLFDFVLDCYPVDKIRQYIYYREAALTAFLRIGLGHYEKVTHLTPSGAMKAINQGKLLVNPLRWWSIEYAFLTSNTAKQNIGRYYEDVAAMLYSVLTPNGKYEGEDTYPIPDNFGFDGSLRALKFGYFLNKLFGRFHSKPIFSLNDIQKVKNKLKSLVVGIMTGKTDIDKIFGSRIPK